MNKEEEILLQGERLDDLHRNGYKIIQSSERFCFGMDAVLLSDFAKVRKGERVLDLGTGTGIIPILLEAKTEGGHYTGLEIQAESANMARRSVQYNSLQDKIRIVTGDIEQASSLFQKGEFDVITTNPPYMTDLHGLQNKKEEKTIARHEVLCSLEGVIRESSKLLLPKGRLYIVHRPFRLIELCCLLSKYHLEPKHMRFVHPYVEKEPNMVLIEALKEGKPRVTIAPPLIVYKEKNAYTDEIYQIYGYAQEHKA